MRGEGSLNQRRVPVPVSVDRDVRGTITVRATGAGGLRFAKSAFTPGAFAQILDPGVARDLALQYVYNPDGSRDLLYQVPE